MNNYSRIKPLLFHLITLFVYTNISFAQTKDSIISSPVRSLSSSAYLNYKEGRSVNMALVAELNNYPAPDKVLEYSSALKLSAGQKAKLQVVSKELSRKAREMGGFILLEEKKLNDLFASGKANDGALIYLTNKIGLYQGELRNAFLQAHLKTQRILTPDQIKQYYKQIPASK